MQENSLENLQQIAYHDSLTNLKNRKAFEEDISGLDARDITLVSIDANNLKKMNDTFGHEMGDRLIMTVADTIADVFGGGNSYRTGGDEFTAILKSTDEILINKLSEEFNSKINTKNDEVEKDLIVSAAIGFGVGGDGKSIKQMLKEADEDMYSNKRAYKIEQKKKEDKDALKGIINREYSDKLEEEQRKTKKIIIGSVIKTALVTALCIMATNLLT